MDAQPENSADTAVDFADVRLARQGDGEAYARLVRRHQETIARQMWRFTRDPRRHAELIQDVFVNAYQSLSAFRGSAPFVHWLRKIAVRTGYACWRQNAQERIKEPLDPELLARVPDESGERGAREAAEVVHLVLHRLPPRDRLVLTLMYLDDCSVAEIAQTLGWTQVMVKVQAWRARVKLKVLLAELKGV
jgi:RNA polymerase sigma-70 factor (ECF subfamily)